MSFNEALEYGLSNKKASLEAHLDFNKMKNIHFYLDYITYNINYYLDLKKQESITVFLNYMKNID